MRGGHWTSNPDTSHAGDSESRNLPLLTDVTTTREAGAAGAAGAGNCTSVDTYTTQHADAQIQIIRSAGARHAIITQKETKRGQAAALRSGGALLQSFKNVHHRAALNRK